MIQNPIHRLSSPDSELVLGIVAPVGADLTRFEPDLKQRLGLFNYKVNSIRLSEFLRNIDVGVELKEQPYVDRVNTYMTAGNKTRESTGRGDILALYAAHKINSKRRQQREPIPRTVHVLRSLKHPEEVRSLRQIYGPGFFLVGVSATREERLKYLVEDQGCALEDAEHLIRRDEDEDIELGQKTRDTFQLADVFIPVLGKDQLLRFLDLVFGAPFETPTRDEYGMFLAFAASLRSADLSRQVGAVVMSAAGDIVATGANDVPVFGGGLYWPGEKEQRDWVQGVDANEKRRNDLIVEIMKKVSPDDSSGEVELLAKGKNLLRGTSLMNIMEFGRAVHAEMEALLSAARSGISPAGGTLFTTTFPCVTTVQNILLLRESRGWYTSSRIRKARRLRCMEIR